MRIRIDRICFPISLLRVSPEVTRTSNCHSTPPPLRFVRVCVFVCIFLLLQIPHPGGNLTYGFKSIPRIRIRGGTVDPLGLFFLSRWHAHTHTRTETHTDTRGINITPHHPSDKLEIGVEVSYFILFFHARFSSGTYMKKKHCLLGRGLGEVGCIDGKRERTEETQTLAGG